MNEKQSVKVAVLATIIATLISVQPVALLPSAANISTAGIISYDHSSEYMLQRFYSGRGYGALIPAGGNDYTYFGHGATMRYSKQEGFSYLANDGRLTNVDPSGTWDTITGGWYALFNTSQFYQILNKMILGTEILPDNPTAYPIVPIYEVWFYNFETIPKSAMKYFLGNLSAQIDSLENAAGRSLWIIFTPCWEFNQGPADPAGSGWGAGGLSVIPIVRGWNIPASTYNSQMANWMAAKQELGITNVLISSHVGKLWSKTYNPYYLQGIRLCDVIGGSAYNDNATDKFEKLRDFYQIVGGNKPLFFFEYNKDYLVEHYADATHINETYALIPQYPIVKGLNWWCPTVYDEATHNAIIATTAQYNGYKP